LLAGGARVAGEFLLAAVLGFSIGILNLVIQQFDSNSKLG